MGDEAFHLRSVLPRVTQVSRNSMFALFLQICVFTWTVFKGEEKKKGENTENHKSDFPLQNRLEIVIRQSCIIIPCS